MGKGGGSRRRGSGRREGSGNWKSSVKWEKTVFKKILVKIRESCQHKANIYYKLLTHCEFYCLLGNYTKIINFNSQIYVLELYIFKNLVSSSHFFSEWVCFTLFLITVLLIITFIHGNSRVVLIDPPQSIRVNALAFLQPSLLWGLSSRKQGDYQLWELLGVGGTSKALHCLGFFEGWFKVAETSHPVCLLRVSIQFLPCLDSSFSK